MGLGAADSTKEMNEQNNKVCTLVISSGPAGLDMYASVQQPAHAMPTHLTDPVTAPLIDVSSDLPIEFFRLCIEIFLLHIARLGRRVLATLATETWLACP